MQAEKLHQMVPHYKFMGCFHVPFLASTSLSVLAGKNDSCLIDFGAVALDLPKKWGWLWVAPVSSKTFFTNRLKYSRDVKSGYILQK